MNKAHIKSAKNRPVFLTVSTAILLFLIQLVPSPVSAQQSGSGPTKNGELIDFREELRQFVMEAGNYARRINPQFKIVAEDALGLIVKPDPEDDTQFFPAQTFIRNIDGIVHREISTLVSKKQVSDESIQIRDSALEVAKDTGLNILAIEFSKDITEIEGVIADDLDRGFVPFVGESQSLSTIPAHPNPITNINSNSVEDISDVKNFLYIERSQRFGTSSEYIQKLHKTNYDAVIVDVYHGRKALTPEEVRLLKFKMTGGKRMVLATMDVTTAASFLYYWKQGWKTGNPPFIDLSLRRDPDRYRTHYWDPAWQSIFYGNANSYLAGIVALGFDGVVIRGLNGWRYYATGETEEEQDAIE